MITLEVEEEAHIDKKTSLNWLTIFRSLGTLKGFWFMRRFLKVNMKPGENKSFSKLATMIMWFENN